MPKSTCFIALVFVLFLSNIAKSEEFLYNTIRYRVISEYFVSVANDNYSGKLVIPDHFQKEGKIINVVEIDKEAFKNCYNLKSITLSNLIKVIPNRAFEGCTSLSSVILPEKLEKIESAAFFKCGNLWSISIPRMVAEISPSAFENCNSLNDIKIEPGNKFFSSENGVLYNKDMTVLERCPALLKSISIPSSVIEIKNGAFEGCKALTSIRLPDSLKTLPNYFFKGCTDLQSIQLPLNMSKIGVFAFKTCSSLKRISVTPGNEHFTSISGVLYSKDTLTLIKCPAMLSNIDIYKNVRTLETFAFEACQNLVEVQLPETIEKIEALCFYECTSLRNLYVPSPFPPLIMAEAFKEVNSDFMIHMPKENAEYYKTSASPYYKSLRILGI